MSWKRQKSKDILSEEFLNVPLGMGNEMKKPKWFPSCPWPKDIWTMTKEEYVKAVPDHNLRTAISGFLMRLGWELAEEDIYKRLREILDNSSD